MSPPPKTARILASPCSMRLGRTVQAVAVAVCAGGRVEDTLCMGVRRELDEAEDCACGACPSWPYALQPLAKTSPDTDRKSECSAPHATPTTSSSGWRQESISTNEGACHDPMLRLIWPPPFSSCPPAPLPPL